jgi:signal transduction histidine kinase
MNKANPVLFRALIFYILPFFSSTLLAQPTELFFQNYTTVNGLCDNSINSIAQDTRGFIWIGTAEGLSRFDGISFRNYYGSRDSTRSFTNHNVANITEYKPHHLIFSSLGKLWCMNTLNNTFYQPRKELLNRPISMIKLIPGGHVILSCGDTSFIVDQDLNIIQRIINPIKNSSISAYPISEDTVLMTNGREHYLYCISSKSFVLFKPQSKFKDVENLSVFLGDGKPVHSYYFSNFWQGLFEYAPDGTIIKHYSVVATDERKRLSHNGIDAILQDNDSILFVATFNGLSVLNRNTGIVRRYYKQGDNNNSIVGNILMTIFKDRSGNIWIGSTEGLSKLGAGSHSIEIINTVRDQQQKYEFTRITKGNEPFLYFSSFGRGTFRINRFTNSMELLDSTIVTNAWSSLLSGKIMYLAGGGKRKLMGYNTSNGQWITPGFLDSYYANADIVTLLYRDSHGDEWYSINHGGGLVRKTADGMVREHYSKNLPVPSFELGYVANATEDINGNSWFGVNKSSLLLQWDYYKKQFKEIAPDTIPGVKGLSFGGVSCLYADKKGGLWAGYEGAGLFSYNISQHKGKLYSIEDGLPSNYIYSITPDDHQRLWLATAKGLVCYFPEANKFITFKKESGLPAEEFGSDAGYFDSETNSLWLTCKMYILRINPDKLLEQANNSFNVYADEIKINGKMLHTYASSSFRHDENNIQFEFTAVDFDNGKDLEFSYQLRGADASWIFAGDKRSAIYNSLAPGDYTFIIKAKRKGDTGWKEIKDPYSFTIATPWWQSWWFRTLVACAFVAIVILSVRRFFQSRLEKQKAILEKQQAVEKERTRIATDMHDDFGASLSRIKFLSEKMQLEKESPEKTHQDLGKISAFSDEMAEKMGEIVWALNQRYDSSGDLISFCRSYASEYLGDKNIKLRFESSGTAEIKLNGEIRRNIFLVVKESLHNIIKHAKASEVFIRIDIDKELHVVIEDNGKGFDASRIRPFADGIKNMKRRIEEVGGRYLVDGTNGTRIEIHVNPGP